MLFAVTPKQASETSGDPGKLEPGLFSQKPHQKSGEAESSTDRKQVLSYNNQQFKVLLFLSGDKHISLIGVLSIYCMFTCYLYVSDSRDNRAQITASQTGIAASHITGQRYDC